MKSNYFLVLMLICSINFVNSISFAQTSVPGGLVSGTWFLSGSPYNIQGNIQIPDGSTLSIEPGVSIIFQGYYKLSVQGRLLAIGTATDSIIFIPADTTVGWKGIRFDGTPSTNDTSKIFYCKLQYGKAPIYPPDNCGGALFFNNFSKTIISNNTIINNKAFKGAGIYCNNSSPIIFYNKISHNSAETDGGGAIYCEIGSSPNISYNIISYNSAIGPGARSGGITCLDNPNISNNIITYNTSGMTGGGINCESSNSGIIINNIITYNTGYNGGGMYCMNGNITIANNTISNNTSTYQGGGLYSWNGNLSISNNVISNNTGNINGGGIFCASNYSIFTNNTIVNNNAANGGALYCVQASDPTFRNCIIYGNTASSGGQQVFLSDEYSDPNFYYCDVQGNSVAFELNGNFYTGTYQNNIDTDPLFVATSSGSGSGFNGLTADWSLQNSSQCINAGDPLGTYANNDIAGNPRVIICLIDLGAYEYQSGPQFLLTISQTSEINCNSYSTGELLANVSGGTPPYSYIWSNGNNNETISDLTAGEYFITVIENNGCVKTDSITISEPLGMLVTITKSDIDCNGNCNGSAIVYGSGATLPYSFLWSSGDTTSATGNDLCMGDYFVTITDGAGCIVDTSITIYSPGGIAFNTIKTDVNCFGQNNGSIYINATGGTQPYQYSKDGGINYQFSNVFTGLTANNYDIVIIDNTGCKTDTTVIAIIEPLLLEVTTTHTNLSCFGATNGTATLIPSGGTLPYSFYWDTTPIQINDTATNLGIGNYSATITDFHGCSVTANISITSTLPEVPICLVSVDTISWKNKILWERINSNGIDGYNIYKEVSTNIYSVTGYVDYSNPTVYIDLLSTPESYSNRYKITSVDTCGNESDLSFYHKTVNLTIAAFGSTMGLNWNDYIDESGTYVPANYFIYRGTSPSNMTLLDSVPGGTNSYNDNNVFSIYYYIIGVKKPGGCNTAKSDFVSYSNKKDNATLVNIANNLLETGTIIISPNPLTSFANLTIPNFSNQFSVIGNQLTITDVTGKIVRIEPLTPQLSGSSPDETARINILRGDLKPGIYFVELISDRIYRGKLIVE